MHTLIDQFARLGLKLEPWNRTDAIFAMDIRGDTFLMQTGDGNNIQVQAHDKAMNQAVLMVHEIPREFEVTISKHSQAPGDTLVRELDKHRVVVRRQTPEGKRHMLLGLDERGHPFVTQLPVPAISVRQAHDILKPPSVEGKRVRGKGANYRKRGRRDERIVRQGEWFFVEVDEVTRNILNEKSHLIERNTPIEPAWDGSIARQRGRRIRQGRGNAHIAEELLIHTDRERLVYVRGKVRHAEHATLMFHHWMRVTRNTESTRPRGVSWVD